jgi:hypothetical protein
VRLYSGMRQNERAKFSACGLTTFGYTIYCGYQGNVAEPKLVRRSRDWYRPEDAMETLQTQRRPLRNHRAACMMKWLEPERFRSKKITNLTYLFPLEFSTH